MKYAIGLVGVIIVLLGSVIYKQENTMINYHFPVPSSAIKVIDHPLYVFVFFSKHDCVSCVAEIFEVLKTLPSQFCVVGVSMGEKSSDEMALKQWTDISFPMFDKQKFKRYLPIHTPTLYGVTSASKVIFMLPGITGQRTYLKDFLLAIYGKIYPSL